MVAAGKAGVYGADGAVDEEAAALIRGSGSASGAALTADQVRENALAALADEVRLLLDEKVVSDPADVDLCMILGAGWPFHLGGITPYLDRSGVSERATDARFAPRGVATLP
jgi:3-hydroxyacyl-CoA dehydrogenase/enoyl-CoA hydratase/3-hydroxybutyryl-CoA epimerase